MYEGDNLMYFFKISFKHPLTPTLALGVDATFIRNIPWYSFVSFNIGNKDYNIHK